MFEKKNKVNQTTIIQSQQQYRLWYISWIVILFISASVLLYESITILIKTSNLVATSNQKIIETAGIDVTATLNTTNVNTAKALIEKKQKLFVLPKTIRHIFIPNTYLTNRNHNQVQSTNTIIISENINTTSTMSTTAKSVE